MALYTLAADQILGTFLLLIIIFSVTDEHNMNISGSLVPLTIGLGLTVIHLRFGKHFHLHMLVWLPAHIESSCDLK